jgi:hypothetical protein
MRVELAATIIIFLIGLMSQYKIWRIIKEQREKRALAQQARDDDLDNMAAVAGKRVEGENVRDMAHWEAAFDGRGDAASNTPSARDSVVGTVHKQSISVRETRRSLSDTIEMDEISSTQEQSLTDLTSEKSRTTKPAPIQVHVIQEDVQQHPDAVEATNTGEGQGEDRIEPPKSGLTAGSRTSSVGRQSSEEHASSRLSARNSAQVYVPPPPEVVPPPFVIPQHIDSQSDAGSTAAASVQGQRNSGRFSFPNGLKRLSGHRNSAMSDSTEALVVPHIEDDRASSVAATLDLENDKSSLPAFSAPSSPLPGKLSFDQNETGSKEASEAPTNEPKPKASPSPTDAAPTVRLSFDPASEKGDVDLVSKDGTEEHAQRKSRDSYVPPAVANLSGNLPEGLSKVAMTYRTNEWAKHLELAETPELDEIQAAPAVGMSPDDQIETPAPVVVEQPPRIFSSQQGIQPAKSAQQANPASSRSRDSLGTMNHSTEMISQVSSPPPAARSAPRRSSSTLNLGGGLSSNTVSRRASGPMRNSSAGSKVREGSTDEPRASRQFPTPAPTNTLMGKRGSMMQMRPASTSFNNLAAYHSSADVAETARAGLATSASPSATGSAESEEIPLAQRKAQLEKQQRQRATRQSYQASPQPPTRQNTWSNNNPYQAFDSHQPQRAKGMDPTRRETMLANWRESVRHEIPTTGNNGAHLVRQPSQQQVAAARRDEMMKEHRRDQRLAQKKHERAEQQEVARNSMMRQGDMLSAHAAAMKRMQANANKKV